MVWEVKGCVVSNPVWFCCVILGMDGGRLVVDVGDFIFILLVAGVEWKCMSRKIAARLRLLQEHAWGSRAYGVGVVCY